jgi:prefoldin subunit 5
MDMNSELINELEEQKMKVTKAIKEFNEQIDKFNLVKKDCDNEQLVEIDNRFIKTIEKGRAIAVVEIYTIDQLEVTTDPAIEFNLYKQLEACNVKLMETKKELFNITRDLINVLMSC